MIEFIGIGRNLILGNLYKFLVFKTFLEKTNYQTFNEFKKYQVPQQGDNCFGNTCDQREVNSKIKINHCFMEVSKKTIYY